MIQQPNSKHCFVCGLENSAGLKLRFYDDGVGEVRAHISVPAKFNGYPGIVHGGIVAAMLDETAGRPIMIGHPNRFMVTANMTIRYRQPVPVEIELLLVGRLLKDRGRIAQAHSELRLPDGTVAAEADLTLVALTAEYAQRQTDLDALGWQVYPDEDTPPSFD